MVSKKALFTRLFPAFLFLPGFTSRIALAALFRSSEFSDSLLKSDSQFYGSSRTAIKDIIQVIHTIRWPQYGRSFVIYPRTPKSGLSISFRDSALTHYIHWYALAVEFTSSKTMHCPTSPDTSEPQY